MINALGMILVTSLWSKIIYKLIYVSNYVFDIIFRLSLALM